MLETIREYAGERLRASGEVEATERRHAQHFLALAGSANLSLGTPGEQRFDLAISEESNLRAALGWALAHDEIEFGLELAVALDDFWFTNHPQEGARWFASLLGAEARAPNALLLRASMGYGNAYRAFDTDAATALYRDALALARELGDERAVALMFLELAMIAFEDGDYDKAERLIAEGQAANVKAGAPAAEVMRLETLARLAAHRDGDIALARELAGQALTVARAAGLAFWEAEEASELASYERPAGLLDIAEMQACDSLSLPSNRGTAGWRSARSIRWRGSAPPGTSSGPAYSGVLWRQKSAARRPHGPSIARVGKLASLRMRDRSSNARGARAPC
jgi:tetratricopeptide (TPR) repeat protein